MSEKMTEAEIVNGLENIRRCFRSGMFGQREVWERQLEAAVAAVAAARAEIADQALEIDLQRAEIDIQKTEKAELRGRIDRSVTLLDSLGGCCDGECQRESGKWDAEPDMTCTLQKVQWALTAGQGEA